MKRKNLYATLYNFALLLVVPVSLCMTSCSQEVTANGVEDEEQEVILNFTFDGEPADDDFTRGVVTTANDIYLYAYQGNTRKANNIRYTKVDGVWKAYSTKLSWPAKDALMSIYGLTDSYKTVALDSMKYRFIHYDIDPDAPHDVWYGSTLNTNQTKSGGSVNMNFTRLVSRVHFACKNSMEDAQVHINKIELHNLIRRGKFAYNEKTNGAGSWTLLDYWGTYSQSFTEKTVPAKTNKMQVTDESFILIPQNTSSRKWKTTDTSPVSLTDADAAHQVYMAVYCRIFKQDSQSGNWDQCVWGVGGENDFKPIYIPLAKTWSKSNSATTIVFDIGQGYKADGTPWEQEAGDIITFSESMLLESELDDSNNIDPWEDDDTPHNITL